MRLLAREYAIALPAWIHAALADVPDVIVDATERTRDVHALADRNWREGTGAPFAALVAESGSGRSSRSASTCAITAGTA